MPDVTTGIQSRSVGEESILVMYAIISEELGTSLGLVRVAFKTHSKTHWNRRVWKVFWWNYLFPNVINAQWLVFNYKTTTHDDAYLKSVHCALDSFRRSGRNVREVRKALLHDCFIKAFGLCTAGARVGALWRPILAVVLFLSAGSLDTRFSRQSREVDIFNSPQKMRSKKRR